MPEVLDFENIRLTFKTKSDEIANLTEQIIDNSKIDESYSKKIREQSKIVEQYLSHKERLEGNARALYSIKTIEFQKELNEFTKKIQLAEFEVDKFSRIIDYKASTKRKLETDIALLRKRFEEKQSEQIIIDENSFACPTCKRDFEQVDINAKRNEMIVNFNIKKESSLSEINLEGKAIKENIEQTSNRLNVATKEKEKAVENLNALKKQFEANDKSLKLTVDDLLKTDEYHTCLSNLKTAEKVVEDLRNIPQIGIDTDFIKSLETKRELLVGEVNFISKQLYTESQINDGKARIKKLEENSNLLASELAELQGKEFLVEQFNSVKMNKIEESINGLFPSIKFKLFNEQLNGGVSEVCDTLINGVPFDSANNAAKIQAGIEIINVLTAYHSVNAPIFVDNAESVILLPQTNSQLIKLIVDENYRSLTIN